MKVTMLADNPGSHHVEYIEIENDYVPDFDADDQWLQIESVGGGLYAIPTRLVLGVVVEGPPEKKKKSARA